MRELSRRNAVLVRRIREVGISEDSKAAFGFFAAYSSGCMLAQFADIDGGIPQVYDGTISEHLLGFLRDLSKASEGGLIDRARQEHFVDTTIDEIEQTNPHLHRGFVLLGSAYDNTTIEAKAGFVTPYIAFREQMKKSAAR